MFDESKDEVFIIEGNMNFYEHFNFTAKQAGSTVLFFAEVIPDEGELCDVLCCKPLDSDDNGMLSLLYVTTSHIVVPYNGLHEMCCFAFTNMLGTVI